MPRGGMSVPGVPSIGGRGVSVPVGVAAVNVTTVPTVSVAPYFAYAPSKVIPGFSGPLIQVTRDSDSATMDVPIASDGFSLDEAAVDAWAGAANVTTTRIYDQVTPGNFAIPTTFGGASPTTYKNAAGQKALPFAKRPAIAINHSSFVLPTISVSSRNFTSISAMKAYCGQEMTILNLVNDTQTLSGVGTTPTSSPWYARMSNCNSDLPMSAAPAFIAARADASGTAFFVDNSKFTGSATTYNQGATTNSMLGGSYSGSKYSRFDLGAEILYAGQLSDAEIETLRQWSDYNFGTVPETTNLVVFSGSSTTDGTGTTLNRGYPQVAASKLSPRARVAVAGLGGETSANANAHYPTYIAPMFNPANRRNILSIQLISNDLSSGLTGLQCYNNLVDYCTTARATGWKIVVSTTLCRSSISVSEWNDVNSRVRAGWTSFADGLADIASDAVLGSSTAWSNPVVAAGDGVHYNTYGHSLMEPYFTAAINPLLADIVDVTAPIITSAVSANQLENSSYSLTLTANEVVTWAKRTGSDAALFTLTGNALSLPAKDFEIPTDADANNTYICPLRATDPSGNFTDFTVTVTITDVVEGGVSKTSDRTTTTTDSTLLTVDRA